MIPSLLPTFNTKDVQYLVNNFQYFNDNKFLFGRLFPSKQRVTLTWAAVEGAIGKNIIANVVARGASIHMNKRPDASKITGDIPKIAIGRGMDENDLYEYRALLAMNAGNPAGVQFVKDWADDYKYGYQGVMGRLEWMAMQSISLGKFVFTATNNNGLITETPIDYQLDSEQLIGASTTFFESGTDGKPFTVDFLNAIDIAESRGFEINVVRMNRNTWARFIQQDEVKNFCATFMQNVTNTQNTPSLASVNAYLGAHADLFGDMRVEVVPSKSIIELADGQQTKVVNFADNVIGFYTDGAIGDTMWVRPVDMDVVDPSVKSFRELMMFKHFATTDPVDERTIAISNAFPVWNQAPNCVLMDTSSTSWNHA